MAIVLPALLLLDARAEGGSGGGCGGVRSSACARRIRRLEESVFGVLFPGGAEEDEAGGGDIKYAAVCSAVAAAALRAAWERAVASFCAQSGRMRSVVTTSGDVTEKAGLLPGDCGGGNGDTGVVGGGVEEVEFGSEDAVAAFVTY